MQRNSARSYSCCIDCLSFVNLLNMKVCWRKYMSSHWFKTAVHFDGIIWLSSNFYGMHSVHLHCIKAENQQLNRIFTLSV